MNTTTTLRRLALLTVVATVLLGMGGCGFINKLRAKDSLNNGVREFNKGHYDEAQKLFDQALSYDPDNTNARMFYAMTLNAKLKRQTSEELGQQTVDAYKRLIDGPHTSVQEDKADAFIAEVYKAMSEDPSFDADKDASKIQMYRDKRREWLLKRANLADQTDEIRAQMLYAVGQSYWEEANNIVKASEKRSSDPTKPPTYELAPDKHEQVIQLINKSHDYMQQALAKNPNYADAYAYEKILFTLESKIVDDPKRKDDLIAKAREAEEKFREINSANQANQAGSASTEGATSGQ